MKVAYIGLGSMGGDQARLIAASDHDLVVFDVAEQTREQFRDTAVVASTIAEAVSGVEVIHVCVRDEAQVNDVLFSPGGVAECARRGALVLVHSTIEVSAVQVIARKLSDRGLDFADAPVTRTSQDASGRFVLTMVGGSDASFEKARPVLDTFSTQVLHVGDCGAAMALKIANNMMTWVQLVVGDLTCQLTDSFGITFDDLKTVTKANGNLTPITEAFLGGARAKRGALTPEQLAFNESQAGIGEKDLQLAIDACRAGSIDTRFAEIARELLRTAMTGGAMQLMLE